MGLVCHVIPNDDVIKRSCNFMSESPSWKVITLQCLVAIGLAQAKKKSIYFFLSLKDNVTLWVGTSYDMSQPLLF